MPFMIKSPQFNFKHQFSLAHVVALILLILPILICIYYIYTFAVEVFVWDEWVFVNFAEGLKNNPLSPKVLSLQAHVDHIAIFNNIVLCFIGWLSKFSVIANMWVSVFVLVCINILLLKLGWKFFRGHRKAYLALIPIPWIMFNLRQGENFLMGYQICMFLVCLLYLMSVLLLSITKNVNRNFVGAAICAFIATITIGAGLMAWPLGFIQLLLQNYFRRQVNRKASTSKRGLFYYQKTTILWLLISIFIAVFYRLNCFLSSGLSDFGRVLYSNWTNIPAYFFASLGNPFTEDLTVNKIFSAATLFLLVWAIWILKNENNSIRYKFIIPLMLMLFGISYCVLLSVGRLLLMPATTSRYATVPILGFAGLYIIVIGGYTRLGQKFSVPMGFLLTLFTLMIGVSMPLGLAYGQMIRDERLKLLQIAQNYKMQSDAALEMLISGSNYIKKDTAAVEKNHWSYFAQKPLSLADLSETHVPESNPAEQYYSLDLINGYPLTKNTNIVIDSSKESSFQFVGWVVRPKTKSIEGSVFVIVDNKCVIPAAYGLSRPDVAGTLNMPGSTYCGYWGMCRSNLFAKGKHSLSLAVVDYDKKHYYRLINIGAFKII